MFIEKMRRGEVALGATITFVDATATEALCGLLDCVFIDMEHNALSLEVVQAYIIATKGTTTTPLVRVPWNDPVLIKPVLDIGAAGVINGLAVTRFGVPSFNFTLGGLAVFIRLVQSHCLPFTHPIIAGRTSRI